MSDPTVLSSSSSPSSVRMTPQEIDSWKSQLSTNGYCQCPTVACSMAFLSMKGMEAHKLSCRGICAPGEYVACPICHVRFKAFLIMEKHKQRSHLEEETPVVTLSATPTNTVIVTSRKTYERNNTHNMDLTRVTADSKKNIFDDDVTETLEEKRQRILAESRQISNARPRGRPPSAKPSPHEDWYQMQPSSNVIQIRLDSNAAGGKADIAKRQQQLAMQEQQLKEYQEKVIRYEKLAEDASRAALIDQEIKLQQRQHQLKHREMEAKKRLASAVQVLETSREESAAGQDGQFLHHEVVVVDPVPLEQVAITLQPTVDGNLYVVQQEEMDQNVAREDTRVEHNNKDNNEVVLPETEQEQQADIEEVKEERPKEQQEDKERPKEQQEDKEERPKEQQEDISVVEEVKEEVGVAKRRPGRPKSKVTATVQEPLKDVIKRKPGRPRKNIEAIVPEQEEPEAEDITIEEPNDLKQEHDVLKKRTPRKQYIERVKCKRKADPEDEPLKLKKKKKVVQQHHALVYCGKCDQALPGPAKFSIHVASVHGGLARPKGESQEFEEDDAIKAMLKEAFSHVKKVPCYRCQQKSFTTFPGLLYHLQSCGKTQDEVDKVKITCSHCDFRCLPQSMRSHVMGKHNPVIINVEDNETVVVEPAQVSASGRVQRRAATKANSKVHEFIDEDLNDDSDDVEFKLETGSMYVKETPDLFTCRQCEFNANCRKDIKNHVLLEHNVLPEDEAFEEEEDISGIQKGKSPRGKVTHGLLTTDKTLAQLELEYRSKNYNRNAFDDLHLADHQVRPLDGPSYVPFQDKYSVKFALKGSSTSPPNSLKCFQSVIHNKSATFFTGGPIWASDWCPESGPDGQDVIALCADLDFDKLNPLNHCTKEPGLIQLWTVYISSEIIDSGPRFCAGIAHNYGKVHWLTWCPSGGQQVKDPYLPRQGLLAAACSDGTVRILAIPIELLNCQNKIFSMKPVVTLTRSVALPCQCLKVVWFRGQSHRVLAASYSDGHVALWDICTQSPLLTQMEDGVKTLLPYRTYEAHSTATKTTLDLSELSISPKQLEFPKYLASGSSDRMVNIWDLEQDFVLPLKSVKTQFVHDVTWMPHHPNRVSVANDDVYLINNTRTNVFDLCTEDGSAKMKAIQSQNSAVWSQSFCPFNNVLVSSTAAGDVTLFLHVNIGASENRTFSKDVGKRRAYLYRTEVSNCSTSTDAYLPTYDEVLNANPQLTVNFVDMPLESLDKTPKQELDRLRVPQNMAEEDLVKYPLLSINRVNVSPNRQSTNWIFTGGQSGLARLHYVGSFAK